MRTGCKPDWCSIESNLSGYDILSLRSATNDEHILIEVKTSTEELANARCIVSRHEWTLAQCSNNISRYFFYLWNIVRGKKLLAIVSVQDMSQHIPVDNMDGQWEYVSVPFRAFSNKFTAIP